jgi:hypothetical protein
MPYWVKRIQLKDGQLVTERELKPTDNFCSGSAPVVGDIITITYNGRSFPAEVIWGNWPGREEGCEPSVVVPLRVREI